MNVHDKSMMKISSALLLLSSVISCYYAAFLDALPQSGAHQLSELYWDNVDNM